MGEAGRPMNGDGPEPGPAFLSHLQSLRELQVTLSLEGSEDGILREGTTGTVEIVGADCAVALIDPFFGYPAMRFGWSEGHPMAPHEIEVFARRLDRALAQVRDGGVERIQLSADLQEGEVTVGTEGPRGPDPWPVAPAPPGQGATHPGAAALDRDPSRMMAALADPALAFRPRRYGSILALGIGTGPTRRGILVLARQASQPFNREQAVLAEILSTQMAIQLDRARRTNDARRLSERLAQEVETATRSLREHNHELAALNAIAAAASPTLDLERQMDIALRKAMDGTGHSLGAIHFVREDDGAETLVFARGAGEDAAVEPLRGRAYRRGEGLPGRVWERGEPMLVPDLTAGDGIEEKEILRRAGCQAVACLPLRARGRTIGTMLLGSERDRPYGEGDDGRLQAVADQVAVVLQNARLLTDVMAYSLDLEGRIQKLGQDIERRDLEMRVYAPVLDRVAGGEMRGLLEETLGRLLACLQGGGRADGIIEAAGVHVVEPRTRSLQLRGQSGLPPQAVAEAGAMAVSRTCIGRAFETGAPAAAGGEGEAIDRSNLRLVAAVPLRSAGAVHGALWVAGRGVETIDPEEMRVLQTAGRLLGVAIENVHTFQDVAPAARPGRELPARLMAAHKMESVGMLAGGIAHEFNNILGAITGYASHIKALAAADNPIHRHALVIEEQALRAASLTRQLLAFARGGQYTLEMVDLNALLRETAEFLSHGIDPRVRIDVHLDPDLPSIEADESQIKQILLNVAVNALEAMPEGGRITLETRVAHLDETYVHTCPGMAAGDYVEVVVDDTGAGIPPEIIDRVFEPFFTTKSNGRGTGLGLSVVYGIVRNHHGQALVNSTPGLGTTVRIYLPAGRRPRLTEAHPPAVPAPAPVAAATEAPGAVPDAGTVVAASAASRPEGPAGPDTGGTPVADADSRPCVLVVDDEPVVREMMREVLDVAGYRVILAEDGVQALERYRQGWGRIHLVLLDMVMPRMGGLETYRRLYGMDRKVRVLICSGYSDNDQVQQALREGALGLFPKPFTSTELLSRVRRHLPPPGPTIH